MKISRLLLHVGNCLARLVLVVALVGASAAATRASIPQLRVLPSIATAAPEAGTPILLRSVHPQDRLEARSPQQNTIFPPCAAALRPNDGAFCLPLFRAGPRGPAWRPKDNRRVEVTRVRGPPQG